MMKLSNLATIVLFFQQDDAPVHTSKITTAKISKCKVVFDTSLTLFVRFIVQHFFS